MAQEQRRYTCAKCGSSEFETGSLRTTGSGVTRFLNVQNQRYTTVSCANCGYTELYRSGGKGIGNFFDFFTN